MPNQIHKREIKYSSGMDQPWEEDAQTGQELYQERSEKKVQVTTPGEFIYGKTLNWYFKAMIWPMFILLLIEIGLRVVETKYLTTVNPVVFDWITYTTQIILFVYMALMAQKQLFADKKQTLALGVIAGLFTGIILAIFKLFWYFELWTFFNLLAQPLLLAVEGLVLGWLVSIIFKKLNSN